jgi:hypothetical protein
MSDYYSACRGDEVEKVLPVDIRGNSTVKAALVYTEMRFYAK